MQNFIDFGKKYGRDLIIFILIIICLSLIIFKIYDDKHEVQAKSISLLSDITENITPEVEEPKKENVFVDIKGAVKTPGVYEVSKDAIINDVIKKSGGFKSTAYKNNINLSKKVQDEMVIYVYTKSEIAKEKAEEVKEKNTKESDVCNTKTYDITDCIDKKDSIINSNDKAPDNKENNSTNSNNNESENKLININTASLEELMTITGIGESKAKAIISYREENGKFPDINCITNVSGIGDSVFAKIKDSITV